MTVGPIIFSVSEAREQLESEGTVVTFRESERTTGDTWYRHSRTGGKQGEVHVEEVGEINPAYLADLRPYARQAGFKSAEDWVERIRDVNDGELRPGYLYRATLLDSDRMQGGENS